MTINRREQGQMIAQIKNAVKRSNDVTYVVNSQSGNGPYTINLNKIGFICSCPDHQYRGIKCKHIHAVEFSFALREQVKSDIIITPIDSLSCLYCSSNNVVKKAIRHNKHGDIQRYLCKECGKRFSFNIGFEKMHTSPQIITSAIQLYFTGESFRNIKQFLKLQGVKVSHVNVYKWLGKYVSLMNKYLEKIKPNTNRISDLP